MTPARLRLAALAGLALGLAGCQSFAPAPPAPVGSPPTKERGLPAVAAPAPSPKASTPAVALGTPDSPPLPSEVPPDLANIPDAQAKIEPPSKSGNPSSYEALGERYTVLKEPPKQGYFESGIASWYGKKFHGRKTASGEVYDMFKMTAAHKTLRLPTYARVTNLANGRSVVVKLNDRGPFIKGRIVDLSYAAATKLDMLKTGHANVTLEVLTPDEATGGMEVPQTAPRSLEVGRYADPIEAVDTQAQLRAQGFDNIEFLQVPSAEGDGHTHILRVGPFENFPALEKARLKLSRVGLAALPTFD
jgi:rare lipoprotein A